MTSDKQGNKQKRRTMNDLQNSKGPEQLYVVFKYRKLLNFPRNLALHKFVNFLQDLKVHLI